MGMARLQELAPFVKEALHKTALFSAFSTSPTPTSAPSSKITSRSGKVGSGDVVIVRSPKEPRLVIAKRVKGVEGDVVSYVVDPNQSDEQKTVVVPKGHVWIQGDNIHNSKDSREFGPFPYALVQSRIFVVVWPPRDFRLIRNKDIQL